MGLAELAPDPLRRWDIVTPSLPGPPGVIMSGFTDRSTAPLDLDVVPYPSVTIAIDLCDDLIVVDETADRDQSGTAVFGLGPRSVRAMGQSVRCMQVRMSPVMAHSVLGTASDLDGELVGLDDLWGREASLLREQLRDAPPGTRASPSPARPSPSASRPAARSIPNWPSPGSRWWIRTVRSESATSPTTWVGAASACGRGSDHNSGSLPSEPLS